MALAPARRPVAAGPAAVPVALVERLPPGPGDQPLGAADVDHQRVGVEQDPGEVAVAGEALDALGRDGQGELQVGGRRADPAEQGLEAGGDLEVGALAASVGDHAAVEGVAGELDQGIRQALLAGPLVVPAGLPSQRLQRVADGGAAGRIEDAL